MRLTPRQLAVLVWGICDLEKTVNPISIHSNNNMNIRNQITSEKSRTPNLNNGSVYALYQNINHKNLAVFAPVKDNDLPDNFRLKGLMPLSDALDVYFDGVKSHRHTACDELLIPIAQSNKYLGKQRQHYVLLHIKFNNNVVECTLYDPKSKISTFYPIEYIENSVLHKLKENKQLFTQRNFVFDQSALAWQTLFDDEHCGHFVAAMISRLIIGEQLPKQINVNFQAIEDFMAKCFANPYVYTIENDNNDDNFSTQSMMFALDDQFTDLETVESSSLENVNDDTSSIVLTDEQINHMNLSGLTHRINVDPPSRSNSVIPEEQTNSPRLSK